MTRDRFATIALGAVSIVLVALLSGCGGQAWSVGPFVPDPHNRAKPDTHWHAALGVYDCDHWMGDPPGSGIWQWPNASLAGNPSRADDPSVYAGLHSHDDGVIHMEPIVASEAGRNATLGLYFDYGGWRVSSTGFTFLGATRTNGDACGDGTGTLQWATARWDGTAGKQTFTVHSGNPGAYKLEQGDIVVIAFVPASRSIATIGAPPSLRNLANALGVENPQPAVFAPRMSG